MRRPGLHYLLYRLKLASATTQTTLAEQECLARRATGRRRIVEIGAWHGVNTRRLRSVMAPDGIVFAVDPFPAGRFGIRWEKLIAKTETSRVTRGSVVFLETYSEQAAVAFGGREDTGIDFLFIDGDHTYDVVSRDWHLWVPFVVEGGMVALHDSRSYPGRDIDDMGPARFCREHVSTDERFRFVEAVDSLTVVERIGST